MGNQCNMSVHSSDELSVDRSVIPDERLLFAPGPLTVPSGSKAAGRGTAQDTAVDSADTASFTVPRFPPAAAGSASASASGGASAAAGDATAEDDPSSPVPVPPPANEVPAKAGGKVADEPTESSGSYANPSAISTLVGDGICAICLEPLKGRAQTIALCGHIFHRGCINSYGGSSCPSCRCPIDMPATVEDTAAANPGLRGLQPGTVVELFGLTTAQQYNGQTATILACDESRDRYTVRLVDGGVNVVRHQNVRLAPVSGPANVVATEGRRSTSPGRRIGSPPNASGHTLTVNEFIARAKRGRESGVEMTKRELMAYARYLGIDPEVDDDLLWIAEEALLAPVPAEWSEHLDSCDRVFYYNARVRTSSWTHPLEQAHRDTYKNLLGCRNINLSDAERAVERESLRRRCEEAEREAREELLAWSEHADEHGRKFFYKRCQRRSSWTEPMPALHHMIFLSQQVRREVYHIDRPRQPRQTAAAQTQADASAGADEVDTQRSL